MPDDLVPQKYNRFMHLRVTEAEKSLFADGAAIAGASVPHWVRTTLTREARRLQRQQRRLEHPKERQGTVAA